MSCSLFIYFLTLFNVKENIFNVITNQNEPKSPTSENHLSIRDLSKSFLSQAIAQIDVNNPIFF